MWVINREQLPFRGMSHEFVGEEHGNTGISIYLVDANPGQGPALHKHEYDEVIVVQEGTATCVVDGEERSVRPGDMVVIPAGCFHSFVNSGDRVLWQIDIHLSPRFVAEWVDAATGSNK